MFIKKSSMSCIQKSIDLLSKREYSKQELKTKLLSYGYNLDEIEKTLLKLEDKNLQSDTRFVEFMARKHASKGMSKLSYELKKHDVSLDNYELAKNCLNEIGSEYERAYQTWQKKFAGKTIDKTLIDEKKYLQKQIRFLLTKGFSYEIAKQVLRNNMNNCSFDDE
ncbi:MAG: regulatory protein RecX [Pseudomonadota bacterium]|jgi:regulatory protein